MILLAKKHPMDTELFELYYNKNTLFAVVHYSLFSPNVIRDIENLEETGEEFVELTLDAK